ncbi:MAG TPA: NAD(P)-binding protein, partial [Candidatus Dormibacteraeota bacterium]|nr:NAD(P)-binding protein [Candidatus Dormibacteraeota bacterium]
LPGAEWAETFGIPGDLTAKQYASQNSPGYYPPAKTGMRGSHDGSWEVAHAMRDGKKWPTAIADPEYYDLVIVGAGISGLSAAYFYRQHAGDKTRILILDNHDDFGGHAKRNEFQSGGRLVLGYGGTQSIASPNLYSKEAKGLFANLGIAPERFATYNDRNFFSSRGLSRGIFFDKETFGEDRLLANPGKPSWAEFLAKTPLSKEVQADIAHLHSAKTDYLPTMSIEQKKIYLAKTSYKDFLLKDAKVHPGVIPFFQQTTYGLYGVGIDAVPAGDLAKLGGHPGFDGMDLSGPYGPGMGLEITRQDGEPYIYHFPDGNASIARMLVRMLIPGVAPGNSMEDIVLAKMDYAKLDEAGSSVRIRLNSTVVHAHNDGAPSTTANRGKEVEVTYVQDGQAHSVRAAKCILACWNMVIPYMCPEMSQKQRDALAYGVKVPLVYTNVLLRNREAFEKLKISGVECPGSFFGGVTLDFPVSMGGYQFAQNADEPCVVHMQYVPCAPGLPARDQQRAGRGLLYSTTFETFERNIRQQLSRMLGAGGFDAARDIQAITVNRWPHGYAYEYNSLYDPVWPAGKSPCEIGRAALGNIHIANSDAGAFAYTNEAIDQAWRAVQEIVAQG